MSGLVCVDASLAAKWVLPEDGSEQASEFYMEQRSADTTLIAPAFMPVEVTNAIRRRVVRRLITASEAAQMLSRFSGFSVSLASPVELHQIALTLAHRFDRPTVYDMHYVALAQLAQCDLFTADRALLNSVAGVLTFVKPLAG